MPLDIALIQLDAGPNVEQNIHNALTLTQHAITQGATAIFLPEMFHFRRRNNDTAPYPGESLEGPSVTPFLNLAKDTNTYILLGSICEHTNTQKVYNTSIWITPLGKIGATYRKMHLFEALIDQKKVSESSHYSAGNTPISTTLNDYKIGLSICVDLRYSSLYNTYRNQGVELITVPSSFTANTGKAHWEPLLRARAIECQCFIVAPNQVGVGTGGITTYGHSMVIDPWGKVIACGSPDKEEVILASCDMSLITQTRQRILMR